MKSAPLKWIVETDDIISRLQEVFSILSYPFCNSFSISKQHNLIMKGCTNEDQEDGSMKRRTFDIRLYWARNEKVTGEAYYCKGSDYCNTVLSDVQNKGLISTSKLDKEINDTY
ncbi:hypothetical protein LOAG_00469 [Loa loa]|uniref:Uncharacterized protein n=1 Tax=Loa loa TaxID=7209 RepID=A0A1S0UB45_LOALO|nr:hypothetical protein LOAG_00469 [Loa loa]EFO28026.1 hypothetical protein LOAG_00469 [Loa loa]